MFRTKLRVRHVVRGAWKVTQPLVYEGKEDYFIIKSDLETDFASIPPPVRVLLDNAGANSEAAVLHDAVWRESQRSEEIRRVDPWDADGLFRRALRETGSTALSRGFMWAAVRLAAIKDGRWGSPPSRAVMMVQIVGLLLLGIPVVLPSVLAAVVGALLYWVASWALALVWWPFERLYLGVPTNWPWPIGPNTGDVSDEDKQKIPIEKLLVIVPKPHRELQDLLDAPGDPTDADIDKLFPTPGADDVV